MATHSSPSVTKIARRLPMVRFNTDTVEFNNTKFNKDLVKLFMKVNRVAADHGLHIASYEPNTLRAFFQFDKPVPDAMVEAVVDAFRLHRWGTSNDRWFFHWSQAKKLEFPASPPQRSPPRRSPPRRSPRPGWTCSRCTLENGRYDRKCRACGKARPAGVVKRSRKA